MQQTRTDPVWWAPLVLLFAFAGIVLSAFADYRVYVLRTSQGALGVLVLAQLVLAVMSFKRQRILRGLALNLGAGFAAFMIYLLHAEPVYLSVSPKVYITAAPIVASALCLFAFTSPSQRP